MKRGDLNLKRLEKLINPKRIKIIKILQKEKKIHQSGLQKKLKLSFRQSKRYIDSLLKVGIIKKQQKKKMRGSPVFISLKK